MAIKKHSVIKELNRAEAVDRLKAVANLAIVDANFRNKAKLASNLGPELAKAGFVLSNAEVAFVAGWLEANGDAIVKEDDPELLTRIQKAVGALGTGTGTAATG